MTTEKIETVSGKSLEGEGLRENVKNVIKGNLTYKEK